MGNDDNLIAEIQQASEKAGEAFWKLPIWEAHMDSLKSELRQKEIREKLRYINLGLEWFEDEMQ